MSTISSKDAWAVKLMRWVARFLSIPWAYGAVFIFWWGLGTGYVEGERTLARLALLIIGMNIPLLMFLGAAIIAGVWGKEAFGGVVLLVDGVLILVCIWVTPLDFHFMALPPLAAGYLFLECHRRSKTSGEQRAYKVTSDKCRECGRKIRENERACIVDGELVCSECEQKQ
jgi:hypothetical protein